MKPFSKCKRPGQQVLGAKKGWLTNSRNYEDMHLAPSKYKSHEGAQKVNGSGSIYANAKLRRGDD